MIKKTLVLLHGWDYRNYTKFGCTDPWGRRSGFISEIEKHFNIVKITFPGFCGESEPRENSWGLGEYAQHVENFLHSRGITPDYILGYSFGGAVAVKWKNLYTHDTKLLLVSPAIIRHYFNKRISLGKLKKYIPPFLGNFLKHIYMVQVAKNPFYIHGTDFLRESYARIVGVDLSTGLGQIPPADFLAIFGDSDDTTPHMLLADKLDGAHQKRIVTIPGGGTRYCKHPYRRARSSNYKRGFIKSPQSFQ